MDTNGPNIFDTNGHNAKKGEEEEKITMADHFDAPGLKPPNMDARIDICDIYAFQKREDTNKSILVLNVNIYVRLKINRFLFTVNKQIDDIRLYSTIWKSTEIKKNYP